MTTSYVIQESTVGWQAIDAKDTTQNHPLGTIVRAKDDSYGSAEFVYLKGVASCVQYSWVTYNLDDGSTTLLAANAVGPVAIAQAAITASYYGWFQIQGKAIGKCRTQYADNARVVITASAGKVDDASVAGDYMNNAKGASTTVVDSGVADFEIERPWVDNQTNG